LNRVWSRDTVQPNAPSRWVNLRRA
jgi:hypothetical protein